MAEQLDLTSGLDLTGLIDKAVKDYIDKAFKTHTTNQKAEFTKYVTKQKADYLNSIKSGLDLKVHYNDEVKIVKGHKHHKLETLLKVLAVGQNALLVGPAGTGKTHAVSQCAEALGIEFYSLSFTPQTTKSDLVGFTNATGSYSKGALFDAVTNGGAFCADELDAANPAVFLIINSLLSNGFIDFPVIGRVKAHKDFKFVGTANTYGFGADRQYVGRNQLDASTLDRFTVMDWEVDEKLEEALAGTEKTWLSYVRDVRQYVKDNSIRAVVSPRATIKGRDLIKAGLPIDDVITMTVKNLIPANSHSALDNIKSKWY